MVKAKLYGTGADADFPVDPAGWRARVDPFEQELDADDEDLPVTPEVLDILGVDPDDLFGEETEEEDEDDEDE